MLAVKAGVGRERAHELIKHHAQNSKGKSFINQVADFAELKVKRDDLDQLMIDPLKLAGSAPEQSRSVAEKIRARKNLDDSKSYTPKLRN